MEALLTYFRRAVTDPLSVPPGSEWWAANSEAVERAAPHQEYLRFNRRRLRGAWTFLQQAGHLPEGFQPPSPLSSGSCGGCGERTTNQSAGPGGGYIPCPNCGVIMTCDTRPPA